MGTLGAHAAPFFMHMSQFVCLFETATSVRARACLRFLRSLQPQTSRHFEDADLEFFSGRQDTDKDEGLGLGNRTAIIVRILGTGKSPVEAGRTHARSRFRLGKAALG